jgi:hypothetical protein
VFPRLPDLRDAHRGGVDDQDAVDVERRLDIQLAAEPVFSCTSETLGVAGIGGRLRSSCDDGAADGGRDEEEEGHVAVDAVHDDGSL